MYLIGFVNRKVKINNEHFINKHSYMYICNMSRKSRSYGYVGKEGVSLIFIVMAHERKNR
jgi:hypothetical protein